MRRTCFSFSLLLISMIVQPGSVQAQGISEMGAAHSISAGQSQGLMNNGTTGALTGTMNNATHSINATTGAASKASGSSSSASTTSTTTTSKRGAADKALRDGDEPPTAAQTAKKAGEVSNKLYTDAQAKYKAGDLVNADHLFRQSLYYRESIWGTKDPAVAKIYEILGDISRKRGAPVEAETCYHKVLTVLIKQYGPGDAVMVPVLDKLGSLYLETFKFSDAVNVYTQVYQLLSRKNGDDDQTVAAVVNLSKAYLGDEDFRLASNLLREYSTKLDKGSESNLAQLASVLELYQTALQKTNQTDKLAGVQARSQEVRDLLAAQVAAQSAKDESKNATPDATATTTSGAPTGDKPAADGDKTAPVVAAPPSATPPAAGSSTPATTSTSTAASTTSTAAPAGAATAASTKTPAAAPTKDTKETKSVKTTDAKSAPAADSKSTTAKASATSATKKAASTTTTKKSAKTKLKAGGKKDASEVDVDK